MSTDIELGQLREKNAQLELKLAEARKEAAKYRTDRSGKLKDATESLSALQKEFEALGKENNKLTRQLEELPRDMQVENDRLKGEIRTDKYRKEFNRLAQEAKADPRALDALWKLAEVDTTNDEIDADNLKLTVTTALERNPFLVETPAAKIMQPAPGGGQGGKSLDSDTFTMSYRESTDPHFTRTNQDRIKRAARDGKLVIAPPPFENYPE